MGELTRMFCPAFSALTTISNTRSIILCFDFQCLGVFFLMFFVDPNPYIRVYFMFYLSVLTLPTAYVVIFGTKVWMRIALVAQLIRMVLIGLHNVFYPLFVAAFTAMEYEGKHPGASSEELLIHSTAFGALLFFIGLIASMWEPAKLFQIYRLLKMLESAPKVRMSDMENMDNEEEEDDLNSVSEAESTNLSDSGYVMMVNSV